MDKGKKGIDRLLEAEQEAQDMISKARKEKTAMLRKAREDSENEIEQYKEKRRLEFERYESEHTTGIGKYAEKLRQDRDNEIKTIQQQVQSNGSKVVDVLLNAVKTVNTNY